MHIRIILILLFSASNAWGDPPRQVRTFAEVNRLVFENNLQLKRWKSRVQAHDGLIQQAAVLPNPEFGVEAENFGGDLDGFRESETTIGLQQRIELGSKRNARVSLAETKKKIAELQGEILARDMLRETTRSVARLKSIEAKQVVFSEQVRISREVVRIIEKKVTAGAVLAVEQTKAKIRLQKDKLALQKLQAEQDIAKQRLAALWGGEAEEISTIDFPFAIEDIKGEDSAAALTESPRMRLAALRHELAQGTRGLEGTNAVPDVSVGLGYRRFEETEDNAFLANLSIELPVFNRNQGAIKSAEASVVTEQLGLKVSLLELENSLSSQQTRLQTLVNEYRITKKSLLPAVETAFSQMREAYQRGRTSYLEMLDAQRTLIETKVSQADIVLAIVELQSSIENLRGLSKLEGFE